MIDKLINFLMWARSKNQMNVWIDRVFSYIFLFVVATLLWKIGKEYFYECSYSSYGGYYYGGYRNGSYDCSINLPWNGWREIIIGGALSLSLAGSFLYGAFRKTLKYEYSILRLLLNSTLPFFTGLVLLALWSEYGEGTRSYGPGWYIYVFGGLYALSPIIHFLKDSIVNEGIFKKILRCYSEYIVSFLIGLAIFVVFFWAGNIFRGMRYLDFAQVVVSLFIGFCIYSFIVWMILSYAWDEVKPIDDDGARSIRKWGLGMAGVFLFIWISPNWKEVIIDGRIDAAQTQLQKYGETAKGYEKAASVWGLKWAMKERYLENRLYEKDLYARIFDTSIENDIDDEVDVNKYRARTSNGTSMLARGENAKVELNFAKHESEIKSDIGAMETTVTYEFQNTDTQNQEVIYSIELPSSESVVTDLKLGLNLELPGLLAPRGAAEKVYNDSLRRNTDPALLEQTGPTTYRLRVFPVLSINDSRTQGRQRVQFKYVTPIKNGENITIMPKTDILNLKLTKKSEIMTRVTEGTKALSQDSFKTDDIKDLLAGKKISVSLESPLKDSLSYCAINTYDGLDMKSFSGTEKKLTKNIVFLDISKSAGANKKVKKRYQELIDTWKNNGSVLDIYTFNSVITSAGYDLSDIEFWGNTDMVSVISYINENAITNANIVILTDDESYERVFAENKTIDYKKLKTNRISLIQIGDKIRTLKTEVTKAILATEGDVLRIAPGVSIDESIQTIFALKNTPSSCEPYTGNNTGSLSAIEGGRDGKRLFGESQYKTGSVLVRQYYPTFLTNDRVYSLNRVPQFISTIYLYDTDGLNRELYGLNKEDAYSQSLSISENGYYTLSGKTLYKVKSGDLISIYTEKYMELKDAALIEIIGEGSHIINQSMSLIALENEQQVRDLERYSNQEDKYDTTYKNFDNTSSPGMGWRDTRSFESTSPDFAIGLDSIDMPRASPASSSNSLFGATKAAQLQLGSSSSDSIGGMLSLSGGGGGGRGGIIQIIVIIVLFPVIAWYVLRKKKPKPEPEAKTEEQKPV